MIIYYMKLKPLYIAATARVNRDITLGPAEPVVPFFPSSPTSPYRRKVRKLMTNNHRTKSTNLSTVLSEVQTYTTLQILYYFLWKGEKLKKNEPREKGIDKSCVWSGVKHHSLSYWSIVMTSPVELFTSEFRVKQVLKVL